MLTGFKEVQLSRRTNPLAAEKEKLRADLKVE